jgi:hypothetical protein
MKQFRQTRYWITEDGRVLYDQKRERRLQHVNGALQVMIYLNGRNTFHFINRLVAECYLPNPDNYRFVNHKDGNKKNNHVDNLEWVEKRVRRYLPKYRKELTDEQVKFIRENYPKNYNQQQLAKMFNTYQPQISVIVNHKSRKERLSY